MKQISESALSTLLKAQHKLFLLEDAGVDSWDGYYEALNPTNGVPYTHYCDNLCEDIVRHYPDAFNFSTNLPEWLKDNG